MSDVENDLDSPASPEEEAALDALLAGEDALEDEPEAPVEESGVMDVGEAPADDTPDEEPEVSDEPDDDEADDYLVPGEGEALVVNAAGQAVAVIAEGTGRVLEDGERLA